MTRLPKITASFRIDPNLWRDAQAKADERGEVLSEVIREALRRYVRRP